MKDKVFVVINGLAGSGKDTFVRYASVYLNARHGMQVANIHRSDNAKAYLSQVGWNSEKTPEVRNLLKKMVDFENIYDVPYRMAMRALNEPNMNIVFMHARDDSAKDELIEKINQVYPCTSVFIQSNRLDIGESNKWAMNPRGYQTVIENNGTIGDLEQDAIDWCKQLINEQEEMKHE